MSRVPLRKSFESGHDRKFLVIIDDTPEFKKALYFAARVAFRTGGKLTMLQVTPKPTLSGWTPIEIPSIESPNKLTDETVAALRAWLNEMGVDKLRTEAIASRGDVVDEILHTIERDEDIAVLVLGASADQDGPGSIISSLTHGSHTGQFPIPIYIVPETLSFEEITAMA